MIFLLGESDKLREVLLVLYCHRCPLLALFQQSNYEIQITHKSSIKHAYAINLMERGLFVVKTKLNYTQLMDNAGDKITRFEVNKKFT